MKKIIYIGNKLKSDRSNLSTIHTLGAALETEGYSIYYASDKTIKILRMLDMIFTFFKYKNKVDFVLIDTYSTYNFYYALIISQLCRVFKLTYFTSLNGGNLPMRLKLYPKMSSVIFNHAIYNIAPSEYLKVAFENHGYNNIKYIPNSIEINKYPILDKKFDKPRLLYVRSFAKIYNPKLAIKVLRLLIKRGVEAELCMIGPDSDGSLQDVKMLARKNNLKVRFTGKLSKTEWTALSKEYNVFINTTNVDNTPVSVIEAMALGLPIVSTNVGGMPFLIENDYDGLLVKPNDVNAMVTAIEKIFNNSIKRNTLIKNARLKAEKFDWHHVKKLWFEVLGHDSSESLT